MDSAHGLTGASGTSTVPRFDNASEYAFAIEKYMTKYGPSDFVDAIARKGLETAKVVRLFEVVKKLLPSHLREHAGSAVWAWKALNQVVLALVQDVELTLITKQDASDANSIGQLKQSALFPGCMEIMVGSPSAGKSPILNSVLETFLRVKNDYNSSAGEHGRKINVEVVTGLSKKDVVFEKALEKGATVLFFCSESLGVLDALTIPGNLAPLLKGVSGDRSGEEGKRQKVCGVLAMQPDIFLDTIQRVDPITRNMITQGGAQRNRLSVDVGFMARCPLSMSSGLELDEPQSPTSGQVEGETAACPRSDSPRTADRR